MEKLFIESTKSSPFVYYSEKTNNLLIKGNSYPNNIDEFFHPLYAWLKSFFKNGSGILTISFRFGYYNTSTIKAVINIISLCNEFLSHDDVKVEAKIQWHYLAEDENTKEDGEELTLLAQFPFDLVEEE